MKNPLFGFFGGRKYFYSVLGVAIVVLWAWQTNDWSQDKLMLILAILGVGVAGNAVEDGLRREQETIYVPTDMNVSTNFGVTAHEEPSQTQTESGSVI